MGSMEASNEKNTKHSHHKRLIAAVSNVYTDIYTLNLTKSTVQSIDICDDFSYEDGDIINLSTFFLQTLDSVYIEDRDRFVEDFEPANLYRKVTNQMNKVEGDYRMKSSDGKYHWMTVTMIRIDEKAEEEETGDIILIVLTRCIDNQMETEENLRDALCQAEYTNMKKLEFLSQMSHEIRTRMNIISGMSEIALKEDDIPEKVKKSLLKIQASSDLLVALVNSSFDMANLGNNEIELRDNHISIDGLIKDIQSELMSSIQNKQIQFDVVIEKNVKKNYIGDYSRIMQILIQILSNAIKFTRQRGIVSLSVEEREIRDGVAYLVYTVEDNGVGMSKEFQEKELYRLYHQEKIYVPKDGYGIGMGLSIVKNLVNLLGGSIKIQSELGVGTKVEIFLPHQLAKEDSDTEYQKSSNKEKKYDFTGNRVLVVEDNAINTEIMVTLLENVGITVETAGDGKKAVELYTQKEENYFQMILMDVQMPIMDGLEATQTIRELDREDAKEIPIIAMTANALKEDVTKALAAGMTHHLAKPVSGNVLYTILNQYFSKKEMKQ